MSQRNTHTHIMRIVFGGSTQERTLSRGSGGMLEARVPHSLEVPDEQLRKKLLQISSRRGALGADHDKNRYP